MLKVAVVTCDNYNDAGRAIGKILGLLGGKDSLLGDIKEILLKPNCLKATDADSAVITHPAFIRAAARAISKPGLKLLLGDSPALGSVRNVAKRAGYPPDIPTVEFDTGYLLECESKGGLDKVCLARAAVDAPMILNLPKLKGHCQMVFTGAVKNLFGCVVGKRKPLYHCRVKNSRVAFGHTLLDIVKLLPPVLTLVDAVVCMEGNGPVNGTPKEMNVILGGINPLAVDMVCAEILGYKQESIPLFVAAREQGLPCLRKDIEKLGEVPCPDHGIEFKRPNLIDITFNPFQLAYSALKGFAVRLAGR